MPEDGGVRRCPWLSADRGHHGRSFGVEAEQRLAGRDRGRRPRRATRRPAAVRRRRRWSGRATLATSPIGRAGRRASSAPAASSGRGGRCPWRGRPPSARSAWCRSAEASPCLSTNARASSSWSGVLSANVSTPFMARLAMPVRVPAGGSSRMPVTPRSSIVSMQRSQRTGLAIWPTIRAQHLAAVVDDLAVAVGDQPGARGRAVDDRRGQRRRGGRRRAPCARCGRRRRRYSGISRALAGGSSASAASCSSGAGGDDLAGAVVVGGGEPVLVEGGEHLVAVAAEDGGHAGRGDGGGLGHRLAALADQHHRLLGGDHAGRRRPR